MCKHPECDRWTRERAYTTGDAVFVALVCSSIAAASFLTALDRTGCPPLVTGFVSGALFAGLFAWLYRAVMGINAPGGE